MSHQEHSPEFPATSPTLAAPPRAARLNNASPDESPPTQRPQANARFNKVSQGRRDALNGRWVIFAPGRSERPAEIVEAELPSPKTHSCPFCAGNESHTPPATLSIRSPEFDDFGWAVRVVPNRFPAVSTSGQDASSHSDAASTSPGNEPAASELMQAEYTDTELPDTGLAPTGLADRDYIPLDSRMQWHDAHLQEPASSFHQLLHPHRNRFRFDIAFDGSSHDVTAAVNQPAEIEGLFEYCELHGGHEVIVETPHHVESLTSLSDAHVAEVFFAYAERMRHWLAVPGVRYVVVFKNAGAAAGASLRHTHSQLIATSLLPPAVEETGVRMRRHKAATGRCLVCDMLAGEITARSRVITESDRYLVYCPFASRLPYTVRIAPKLHHASFEQSDVDSMKELAKLTRQILSSLETMFVACAYNYTIHTCPIGFGEETEFHWWMEIFPRLTKVAGFEWGSDCYINPVTPEVAAEHFRG